MEAGMPTTPNLRMLLEERMLSQVELAERSGVAQATISHLERGRSGHYGTIRRLAKALRVKAERLVLNGTTLY
jgi:transcriptional regulator with XRE-family HTH domain